MKLNQIIAGCALAVGLMAFAPQSQAGIVYANSLFSPLSIKATFSFTYNGKVHKFTGTSGQILNYYGYPSGTVLAYYDGYVYAINANQGWYDNLSDYGDVYVDLYETSYSYTYPSSGGYIYNESGYLYVDFYSDGYDYYLSDNNIAFATEGNYTRVYKQSVVGKNFIYSVSDSIKSSNLTGEGWDSYYGVYPSVSATATVKGSGKLVYR